jgi:hypothetical protein
MGLRDIKAKARRALHTAMQVPASYYATALTAPRLIHVRVHTKWIELGGLKGTSFNYAETEDRAPRIVFDRTEVPTPLRNSLVVISAEEGYRVGQTEPIDGMTVTADVTVLSAADLAGKTLPGSL